LLGASLFFAVIKPKPMRLLVEKATELGVCALQPVVSERVQLSKGDVKKQLAKLDVVALEAAEQSERLTVPPIFPPTTLQAAVGEWLHGQDGSDVGNGVERIVVVCEERSENTAPLLGCLQTLAASTRRQEVALVVGPEGGWSPGEVDALIGEAGGDVSGSVQSTTQRRIWRVSLGDCILRAETAAMYVLSTYSALMALEAKGRSQ